ncbi:Uncharacterised protein [Vibrio cholerae]|nr:Uncharacterised protein [Vibrio cholerae]
MPLELCHLHGNHTSEYECSRLDVQRNVDLVR